MIHLPQDFRDLLAEQLDLYLESDAHGDDHATVVQDLLAKLQAVASECELEQGSGDIVFWLENEADLEDGLFDLLLEEIEDEDLEDFSGEDLVTLLEKLLEIQWADEDEESFGVEELEDELEFQESTIAELEDDY